MSRFEGFSLLEESSINSRRRTEGWGLLRGNTDRKAFVSALANSPFSTDEEALTFVKRRADEGSEYHQQAIAWVLSQRLTE